MTDLTETTTTPVSAPTDLDCSELVDRDLLSLIADYAKLSGARLNFIEADLIKLEIAPPDARFFGNSREHLLALTINAVERHQTAELPVIGSSFWNQLTMAIRARGHRHIGGVVPITAGGADQSPDIVVSDAQVELVAARREHRRIAIVSAKISLSAGTHVEEELVSSDAIDLTTALPIGKEIGIGFKDLQPVNSIDGVAVAEVGDSAKLIARMIDGFEREIQHRVSTLQGSASRQLQQELTRIDQYYARLKNEVKDESGAGSAALKAIDHEHERRRTEETRRHGVRAEIEPVQLLECGIVAETVKWKITGRNGVSTTLVAHRYLSGYGQWDITCPKCGQKPENLCVCRDGHVVGIECSRICSVCHDHFCSEHGYAACAVDGEPVCAQHAEICHSCDRPYCSGHEVACAAGGHLACATCVQLCALCATTVCVKHAIRSGDAAPRGMRILCEDCVVYCEGGTSEPIGRDEATQCHTCANYICERHQVFCVVDNHPHCSKHLRKTDKSRRFVCEAHRAQCDDEPSVIFAADEVERCVQCGSVSCGTHGDRCFEDGAWLCRPHLAPVGDLPHKLACERHRTTCYIDGKTFSLRGTARCDVCQRASCRAHTASCSWCGGSVCVNDMQEKKCRSCNRLHAGEIPDQVLAAMSKLHDRPAAREWLIARDASRYVVQLKLGWSRNLVLVVPHETGEVVRALKHSLLGSSNIKVS
jgi:hypothetical protein